MISAAARCSASRVAASASGSASGSSPPWSPLVQHTSQPVEPASIQRRRGAGRSEIGVVRVGRDDHESLRHARRGPPLARRAHSSLRWAPGAATIRAGTSLVSPHERSLIPCPGPDPPGPSARTASAGDRLRGVQDGQDIGGMALRLDLRPGVGDPPVRTDEERGPRHAPVRLSVVLLLDPGAVCLGDRVVGIGQQRERQPELLAEGALAVGALRADPPDVRAALRDGRRWRRGTRTPRPCSQACRPSGRSTGPSSGRAGRPGSGSSRRRPRGRRPAPGRRSRGCSWQERSRGLDDQQPAASGPRPRRPAAPGRWTGRGPVQPARARSRAGTPGQRSSRRRRHRPGAATRPVRRPGPAEPRRTGRPSGPGALTSETRARGCRRARRHLAKGRRRPAARRWPWRGRSAPRPVPPSTTMRVGTALECRAEGELRVGLVLGRARPGGPGRRPPGGRRSRLHRASRRRRPRRSGPGRATRRAGRRRRRR